VSRLPPRAPGCRAGVRGAQAAARRRVHRRRFRVARRLRAGEKRLHRADRRRITPEALMETHVKVLGAPQILMRGLWLFAALLLTVVFAGGLSAMGFSGDPDAHTAMPIVGFVGTAIVALLVVMSLPGILTGIGLIRLRPWARIVGIVLSVLSLMAVPVGTLVGIYGLWVLFSKDTEKLFEAQSARPAV